MARKKAAAATSTPPEPRVTVRHLREMRAREGGWCVPGARAWCQRYGFDWDGFVRHGVPCTEFEATGDDFGIRLAALAREEAAAHGR